MKPSPFFVLLSSVIPVPAMVMTDPHIRLSIHFQVAQFHLFRGSPAKKGCQGLLCATLSGILEEKSTMSNFSLYQRHNWCYGPVCNLILCRLTETSFRHIFHAVDGSLATLTADCS